MTQGNWRDQMDEAVLRAKMSADEQPPDTPDVMSVLCTGCGATMLITEGRVPRSVTPPSGILTRQLSTGKKTWYCSEQCFHDSRERQ